jgi:hypothetical protein
MVVSTLHPGLPANVENHLPDSQPVLGTALVEMAYLSPVSGFFPFA